MNKRIFIASLAALLTFASGCSTTGTGTGDPAARAKAIDASVDSALTLLYQQEPSSRDLVGRAAGVLVFPSVTEAGFIIGASRGTGALRVGGKTVSYHATSSGSFGLQAGAQSSAVFLLFMTQDALRNFQNSRGWTIGADASVTLLTVGATANMTTATAQQPIIGYVLSNRGLLAGVRMDGTRITTLKL
jgi:lipid-binding SYLF domain-containing protein